VQKQKVQEQKVQEQKVRKQKASRRKCSIPKLRFFISFIPQFVHRSAGHAFLQFVLLGTVSVVLNARFDRDPDGWAARKKDSILFRIPAAAENRDRCHHDRTRNLSLNQREQVGAQPAGQSTSQESGDRGNRCAWCRGCP